MIIAANNDTLPLPPPSSQRFIKQFIEQLGAEVLLLGVLLFLAFGYILYILDGPWAAAVGAGVVPDMSLLELLGGDIGRWMRPISPTLATEPPQEFRGGVRGGEAPSTDHHGK